MLKLGRLACTAFALVSVTAAFAASAVGTWNGKIDMSGMKIPNSHGPDGDKQINMMKQMMGSMKITLNLKGDHTYVVTTSGGMQKTPKSETGKWTQSGNVISVTGKNKTEKMTLSANGKTMTMAPDNAQGLKIIFTH